MLASIFVLHGNVNSAEHKLLTLLNDSSDDFKADIDGRFQQ